VGQEEILKILEKIKNDKCPYCEGKKCERCFNTGKRIVTSREIMKMLSSTKVSNIYNINISLRKLEKQKEIKRFIKLKVNDGDLPRVYFWRKR